MQRDVRRTRPLPHTVSVARPARGRRRGKTVPSQPPAVLRRSTKERANRDLPAMGGTPEGPRPARERGVGRRRPPRRATGCWTSASGAARRRRSRASSGSRPSPSRTGVAPGRTSRPPRRAGPTRSMPYRAWSRPGSRGMGRSTAGSGSPSGRHSSGAACSSPIPGAPRGTCNPARGSSGLGCARSATFSPRSTRAGGFRGGLPVRCRVVERIETSGLTCGGAVLRLVRWPGSHGSPRTPAGDREGGGRDAH